MARKKKDRPLSQHSMDELQELKASLEDRLERVHEEIAERERTKRNAIDTVRWQRTMRQTYR